MLCKDIANFSVGSLSVVGSKHVFLTLCLLMPASVLGHGRLIEPPSRATMWRYGYNTPPNYNDNQLFCGGFAVQWNINKGKCGVCGDPWQGPREHEAGGKYATGLIVRRYDVGANITVIVQITASHLGYFEFRLCPVNDPNVRATWQCLNKHLLPLADGSGTRYYVTRHEPYNHQVRLRLPDGLSCTQCVLQWKYNAGNNWGTDAFGKGCRGCGAQEQFYACADIAIGDETALQLASQNAVITPVVSTTPLPELSAASSEQSRPDWLQAPIMHDERIDLSSGNWFTGNLNLTIISQRYEAAPPGAENKHAKPAVDGRQLVVTDNDRKNSHTDLLNDNMFVYDNQESAEFLEKDFGDFSSLGHQRFDGKIEDFPYADDGLYPYSYVDDDNDDDDDESSGSEDYEYINLLQSLIETLQLRLIRAKQLKSAAVDVKRNSAVGGSDISGGTKGNENRTTDNKVMSSSNHYKGSHQRNVTNSFNKFEMSKEIIYSQDKGDREKLTEPEQTGRSHLIRMLMLSSKSATVKP